GGAGRGRGYEGRGVLPGPGPLGAGHGRRGRDRCGARGPARSLRPRHMGFTAENIAAKYGFTRAQQDEFSVASHKKAAAAIEQGFFDSQITPVEIKSRKGVELFKTDEHVRKDANLADLGRLKTVFKKDGTVTAGNASGINDAG